MDLINQYSSDEEIDDTDLEIPIYLLNYHAQMKTSGLFTYIPWNPSRNTINQLNLRTSKIINDLQLQKFSWIPVNRYNSSLKYHITVFPNIVCKPYMVEQVNANLNLALSNLKVDSNLIVENDHYVKLQNQLLLSKTIPSSKCIRFKFENKLSIFSSPNSEKVFLAATLKNQSFFNSVSGLIQNAIKDLPLISTSDPYLLFHVTLQVGEDMDSQQMQSINDQLAAISVDFDDIDINVDKIVINTIGAKPASSISLLENCST